MVVVIVIVGVLIVAGVVYFATRKHNTVATPIPDPVDPPVVPNPTDPPVVPDPVVVDGPEPGDVNDIDDDGVSTQDPGIDPTVIDDPS